MTLHEALAARVVAWKHAGYPVDDFPAIAEILEWAHGIEDTGNVRFLRPPQLRALETYWYLRLVERTPHILDLYRRLYPSQTALLEALGLGHPDLRGRALDLGGVDALIDAVRRDDDLVKTYKLEAIRETLTLDYPSYILALAMGAGKTILIGSIVAAEFAMAIEYPDGPFVQNALVFAPGKTPIESLRELLSAPYDTILPARFHRLFAASVKFTFTRDGDPDIPTPFFERQPLRDVVIWYGLSQGIRDNILKDVSGNIQEFDFDDDTGAYLRHVISDFFRDYGEVRLPNGAAAKLAIYFPQTDDLAEYRPIIDVALASAGVSPALVLVNTSDATLMGHRSVSRGA